MQSAIDGANDLKPQAQKRRRRRPKVIMIQGKRWCDYYGNTYFSSTMYFDGDQIHRIDYEYGGGQMYEQVMFERIRNGFKNDTYILPQAEFNEDGRCNDVLWTYCRRNNIKYTSNAVDVPRKKDL